jgi:uncharacterized protein (TIGR03083 family)
MPRSFTKAQLLEDARCERAALEALLEKLTPEEMIQPGALGDWSVKDVLAHLTEWEQMALGWIQTGLSGGTPAMPAEGYKWNQLPALNRRIYEKHCQRPLAEILEQFKSSYEQVIAAIEGFSEEVLFARGYYRWAGNNALAAYFHSCTAAHYLWARKEIQKKFKTRKAKLS